MAAIRTTDTGQAVTPVEITDGVTGTVFQTAFPNVDGYSAGIRTLPTFAVLYLYNGLTWDRARTPARFVSVDLAAATAETSVWTPAAGRKFRLMGLCLTPGAACDLTLKDGTGGATLMVLGATAAPLILSFGNGILSGAANNVLTVVRSVLTTLRGVVMGTDEA